MRPTSRRAATRAETSASPIDEPGPEVMVIDGALRTLTASTTTAGRTASTPRSSRKATHPSQKPQSQTTVASPTMNAHWTKALVPVASSPAKAWRMYSPTGVLHTLSGHRCGEETDGGGHDHGDAEGDREPGGGETPDP